MPEGICPDSYRGEAMNLLFISLGCDKNLVDSEVMLGIIEKHGYTIVDDEESADVIVINTCCFIHDAKEESIRTILEMAEYKKAGRLKVLIAAGCLAQRYKEEILTEIPEVDAVLGAASYGKIAEVIEKALKGGRFVEISDAGAIPPLEAGRLVTTGGHFAYLKIAEGCDKHCTYCIIPKLRGNYRSVPLERLVKEAKELAEWGVRELILVAQETTLYGKDLYGEKSLHRLLRELCKISGLRWIRLLYCYPEEIDDNLIKVIKEEKKICHYLDIPIQHSEDEILKKMGRKTTKRQLVSTIRKLRKEIPDIVLRTTLITGFPGETKEQHVFGIYQSVGNFRFHAGGMVNKYGYINGLHTQYGLNGSISYQFTPRLSATIFSEYYFGQPPRMANGMPMPPAMIGYYGRSTFGGYFDF